MKISAAMPFGGANWVPLLNQLDDFSAHLANLDTEAADPGNGNRSIHIAAQARPSFCSWNMERAVQFG
jgi:hypothetical protein